MDGRDVMDVQTAGILGIDPQPLRELINNVWRTPGEVHTMTREAAVALWDRCLEVNPDTSFIKLVDLIRTSRTYITRRGAVLLFKCYLVWQDFDVWRRLSIETRTYVKSILLKSVLYEVELTIVDPLCHAIADIAMFSVTNGRPDWDELLPFIFQCVYTYNPKLQKVALMLLEFCPEYVRDTLIPPQLIPPPTNRLQRVRDKASEFLSSSSPDLRIAALKALVKFINCLSAESRVVFEILVMDIVQTLAWAALNEEQAVLELLNILCEMDCSIFYSNSRSTTVTMDSLLNIAISETCSTDSKHRAIRIAVKVVVCANTTYVPPADKQRLAQIMLHFLTDIPDFPTWFQNHKDCPNEDVLSAGFDLMKDEIKEMACALGGVVMFQYLNRDFNLYMDSEDWRKRHAAMICIAEIVKGRITQNELETSLNEMVNFLLKWVEDGHPRVRWAAACAIEELGIALKKFPPFDAMRRQVREVLDPLIEGETYHRVQGSARQLFQRLQGPMEEDTLKSHFEKIILIWQKQHYREAQKDNQDPKQLQQPHGSHALALSQVCPNNLNGGAVLTPLDLCDAISPSPDFVPVGYHTGGLPIQNHGNVAAMVPPASSLPGSSSATGLGSHLASASAPLSPSVRYGIPRAGTLSITDEQQQQQHRIQQLSQMSAARNTQQSGTNRLLPWWEWHEQKKLAKTSISLCSWSRELGQTS